MRVRVLGGRVRLLPLRHLAPCVALTAALAWPGAAAAEPTVTEFTGGIAPGFSAGGGPSGIVQGPDNNLWFTQFNSPGRVARITPAGVVTEFTGGVTPGFTANAIPARIVTGPDGNLWFTERQDPGGVARITPAGVVTEFRGGVAPGFTANGGPFGIGAGPDGNIWFTQVLPPGRVARITPAGVVTEFTGGVTPGFTANSGPAGIATGADGNLWFTQQTNPGRVARITPAGVVTQFTGGVTPGFSANGGPLTIAAGPDGNLWFTQLNDPGRVGRITTAGVVTEFTGGVTPGFTANSRPSQIAPGPDGNMWFTEDSDPGRIARITPAGVVTEFTGGLIPGFSAGSRPLGITTGPDGNIWFAQFSDPGRIGRFILDGGPVPPPPAGKRPSGTSVICNRGPNPGDDSICTATVGDAGPPPLGPRPSGTVRFTANSRGSFRTGAECTLQPVSTSPSVSSCSVTYIPGDGSFPDVTADYQGDATFLTSKGRTSVVTGGVFGLPAGTLLNIDACMRMGTNAPLSRPARAARRPAARAAIRATQQALAQGKELSPGDSKRWCNLELAGSYVVEGGEYVVGTAIFGVGMAMGAGGAVLIAAPEPTTVTKVAGVGLMAGGTAISMEMITRLWGQESAQVRVREDPPDPRFRTVAKPAKARRIVVRPGAGLGRADAGRLTTLLASQSRASALATALAATLDKVGGAQKAKNRRYEGIQTRAAIGYARELSRLETKLVAQSRSAARVLRKFKAFNRRPSQASVRRFRTLVSTGKLPKKLKAFFAAIGFDAREIKRLAADAGRASGAEPPPTLAEVVGGAKALELHRLAAASLRLYVNLDEVIASSKLK
jgi:streptogramin lyase